MKRISFALFVVLLMVGWVEETVADSKPEDRTGGMDLPNEGILDYHFGDGGMLLTLLVAVVLLLSSLACIYLIKLFMKRFVGWIYEKRRKAFHEKGFTECPECGRSFSGNPHPKLLSLFGLGANLSPKILLEHFNPLNKIRAVREGLKYLSGQKHPLGNLTLCSGCGEPNDEVLSEEEEITRPKGESEN